MNYFDNSATLCGLWEKPLRALRLKHVFALLAGVVFISINSFAQLDTAIVRTFGGPYYEEGRQIIECAEGGYAIIGTTGSDQLNNTNFYLLRLDEELNCLWSQNYGGAEVEWGYSIVEDANNNLLVCGYTNSYGEGGYDILVYKVDPLGNVLWQKTYGGSDWDFAYKMIAHPTEGYLICGKTYSYGNGGSDAYLLHISEDGNPINEWTYGGEGDDEFVEIALGENNLIYTIGSTNSFHIDGLSEAYLLVIEANNSTTTYTYSFEEMDTKATSIIVIDSNNLLITANLLVGDSWDSRILFKIDSNYYTFWNDIIDIYSVSSSIKTPDGGFIAAGTTTMFGLGGSGALIERRTNEGSYLSGAAFGTSFNEDAYSLAINGENQPLMIGRANGYSNNENYDIYLVQFPNYNITSEYHLNIDNSSCFLISIDEMPTVSSHFYIDSYEQLQLIEPKEVFEFELYDISGRVVLSSTSKQAPLNINNLASGAYIISPKNSLIPAQKLYKK